MYFHVMVGAVDLEASRTFYDATFKALGVPSLGKFRDEPMAYMYGDMETGLFFVTRTQDGQPATHANGGTIMFKAKTTAEVEAWYQACVVNGGATEDKPSPGGLPGTIMCRMRDPTGNKVSVVAFT